MILRKLLTLFALLSTILVVGCAEEHGIPAHSVSSQVLPPLPVLVEPSLTSREFADDAVAGLWSRGPGVAESRRRLEEEPNAARARDWGWAHLAAKDYSGALRAFRSIEALYGVTVESQLGLGMAFAGLEDIARAASALRRAVELSAKGDARDQYVTNLALGRFFLFVVGDPRVALPSFKTATEVDPARADGWLGVGVSEDFLRNHSAAITAFERAVAIDDPMILDTARLFLAESVLYYGNRARAEAEFKKVDPRKLENHLRLRYDGLKAELERP